MAYTRLKQVQECTCDGVICGRFVCACLDRDKWQIDELGFFLGLYGDVQRVKILFNKKDNALVQYAEPAQAQLGKRLRTVSDLRFQYNLLTLFSHPTSGQDQAVGKADPCRWIEAPKCANAERGTAGTSMMGSPNSVCFTLLHFQDAGLTKDYSQSPLHRFKKPGSKNYLNIYPPSATLHLSNIP